MSPAPGPLDTAFDRRYECEAAELPPDGRRQFLIPPAGGGHELAVRFEAPGTEAWVGVFAGGEMNGRSGLHTTPDPEVACVVAEGEGWLVRPAEPGWYERVRCTPVLHVLPVPARGLLVFGSHTDLVAYSAAGIAWTTERLAYSEFEVTEVGRDSLTGVTEDVPARQSVTFTVDLATGASSGGPFG